MAYKDKATEKAALAKRLKESKTTRDARSLALLNDLLPLPANATFEELIKISKKMSGNNVYYPELDKAIRAHPSFKAVIADLNTGELGRNYSWLKKPETTLSNINKVYKEVKGREGIANKTLDAIYKRSGNDPVKLITEYNNLEGKASGAKLILEKKIRSLPAYKEFLKYDKEGLLPSTGKVKSPLASREFLRFGSYLKLMDKFPKDAKFSDYISLTEIEEKVGKKIVTPEKTGGSPRYKLFDYNQLTKYLGDPIRADNNRRYFNRPSNEQITKLTRFFKDGTYLYGENTEDIVKAIHNNEKLRNMLSAKNFPELNQFQPELEKVLGKTITDAQAAHGTRVYSDWTKGALYKNMGLDIKPSAAETRLGNKIYSELEGFKRNNKWAQGEYLHAMREIKRNMPKEAGSLGSFKTYMSKYLPKGFLENKNLNVNEIFSIKQSARNKAFPYAYFVDVIDADINQKNLANFQAKLSSAVYDTRDLISRLRAGDQTVSYDNIVNRINKFQNERKTHGATIKRNFPGKNFNLADIVLGSEKEILKSDFDIADKVYSAKNLEKWKKQGIDLAQHAKTEGFAMTGADKRTSFLFRDLVNTSKDLFNKGSAPEKYEIAFKLGCVGQNADGGRIGFALGSSVVKCVNTKLADETHIPKLTQLDDSTPLLGKLKNAATGFLGFVKKGGKYGAIAAGGAAVAGLVKTFMNDDPTTYLSNEDQQKNMLISMVTDPIDETPEESPAILDYQLPTLGAVTAAGMVPGGKRVYDVRRRGGPNLKPAGPVRSALGLKGVLGKGLAATATPLGLLALEPLHIAGQVQSGDSLTDIATNPLNYLGPTFASGLTKEATRFASPTMSKIMRMGMSPTALRGLSRFGGVGLAASLGIQGVMKYDDWRNKRGWFSEE